MKRIFLRWSQKMKNTKWEHIIILFIGLWLLSIPWSVGWGFGSNDINVIMWNFLTVGATITITSIIALRNIKLWTEWLALYMGVWLILSPVLLVYYDNSFFLWNSIIFGLVIVGLTLLSIPTAENKLVYMSSLRKNHKTHI